MRINTPCIPIALVTLSLAACNDYQVVFGGADPDACADGVKNGSESDVDCGGADCGPCAVDAACEADDDCESDVCQGTCGPPEPPCSPGAVRSCYDGPAGTLGQGICTAGTQICDADGSGFGPCLDQTLPAPLEDCATGADDDCNGAAACEGATQWSKAWGSAYTDDGWSTVTDTNDNIYVVGRMGGPVDFGGGMRTPPNPQGPDIFIVKLDAGGTYLWDRVFHATSSFTPYDVDLAVAADGSLYLTSGFAAHLDLGGDCQLDNGNNFEVTAFLAKLDASGACAWAKKFGDGTKSSFGGGVRLGPAGEPLVLGAFSDTITFDSLTLSAQGSLDVFAVQFGADASPVWAKSFGGPDVDYADAAFDSQGNVVVSGSFQGDALLDGVSATSAGDHDLFVGKYGPDGSALWPIKTAGDADRQLPGRVLVGPNDVIVLTGSFLGTLDLGQSIASNAPFQSIYALKLAADGTWIHGQSFPGGQDELTAAQLDPLGNLVLTGTSSGNTDFGGGPLPVTGGYYAFMAKLDPQLGHIWSHAYAGTGAGLPIGLAIDSEGNTIVTGEFEGTLSFGAGELVATPGADPCPIPFLGCHDTFLAKLAP